MDFEAAVDAGSIGLEVFTAKQSHHHDGAEALVARRYGARGYSNTRLSTRNEAALTVCSARQGERIVGTIAVRFDSEAGFNAESTFPEEIRALREAGHDLCEFSRLAVDEDIADSKHVLAQLFHLAYLHGHRLGGCRTLIIEVNPRHVAFYRRLLGFELLAGPRTNMRVVAPAVLMTLDLAKAEEWIAIYGGNPELSGSTRMLYPYFYGAEEEADIITGLRQ